jgi:hypothetical protein
MTKRKNNLKVQKNSRKKILVFGGIAIFASLAILTTSLFFLFKQSDFLTLDRVNLVLIDRENQPFVLSFNDKEVLILTLPAKEKIAVSRGYGEYELGKVYPLGELEGKGGRLLEESLRRFLKAPFWGFVHSSSLSLNQNLKNPKTMTEAILKEALISQGKTDLSKKQIVVLIWRLKRIAGEKFEVKNFNGEQVDYFKDSQLRSESLSLSVLNATDQLGLAAEAALLLENVGGRVVRVADAPEKVVSCRLIISPMATESYTFFWLKRVFSCPATIEVVERADMVLILGQEDWKKMSEKW